MDYFEWFRSNKTAPKGIVLFCHGLNHRPESYSHLIKFLNNNNFSCLNIKLTGHRSKSSSKECSSDIWKDEFRNSYFEAQEAAKFYGVPLYFIGFSTGALCQSILEIKEDLTFDKKIFLSPALSLKKYTSIMKLFSRLPISHPQMGANKRIEFFHMNAYKSFFKLFKEYNKISSKTLDTPTRIFMRARDEIISLPGIHQFINKNKLENWNLYQFEPLKKVKFQHMCFCKFSLSTKDWIFLTNYLLNFFNDDELKIPEIFDPSDFQESRVLNLHPQQLTTH